MKWSMLSHIMYILKDKSRKILTVCLECLKLKFMTANIYRNYLTYKIVGVFSYISIQYTYVCSKLIKTRYHINI